MASARRREVRPRPLDVFKPLIVVNNLDELVFESEDGLEERGSIFDTEAFPPVCRACQAHRIRTD
jgi:hypothetical protein